MAKRKVRKPKHKYERFKLTVTAASVSIGRMGPDVSRLDPDGKASSSMTIEGRLDHPAYKGLEIATVLVFEREERAGYPGAAVDGEPWHIVCTLPREQFAHLLALVMASRLDHVDLLFEDLRRGNGKLRTVSFDTVPVPSDAEMEEDNEHKESAEGG